MYLTESPFYYERKYFFYIFVSFFEAWIYKKKKKQNNLSGRLPIVYYVCRMSVMNVKNGMEKSIKSYSL